jgi:hypothetical protein
MGYGRISQRAALSRRPLRMRPLAVFLRPEAGHLRTAFISIACMRYRRGRPEQGVPLRAEGFPKRRCQLESVAAERRI